jgi:hypothetical protein
VGLFGTMKDQIQTGAELSRQAVAQGGTTPTSGS